MINITLYNFYAINEDISLFGNRFFLYDVKHVDTSV